MPKQKALVTTKRMLFRGHYWNVTRDYRGRFVKWSDWKPVKRMWRLTLILKKYPVHDKYRSHELFFYSGHKPTEHEIQTKKQEFYDSLEKETGYDENDFWFNAEPKQEITQVSYDSAHIGETEIENREVAAKK